METHCAVFYRWTRGGGLRARCRLAGGRSGRAGTWYAIVPKRASRVAAVRSPSPSLSGDPMRPTLAAFKGRSAWKGPSPRRRRALRADRLTVGAGPYFVAFPNLREALDNNVPIKTQARACTILPNFVG